MDDVGRTALHWAAYHGVQESALALLEKGIEVDMKDQDGWTALQIAGECRPRRFLRFPYASINFSKVSAGNLSVVQALIGKADVNARRKDRTTPLYLLYDRISIRELISIALGIPRHQSLGNTS